jgi:hypothetical protein
MLITNELLQRLKDDWTLIASEQITVELITTNVYCYGSELAISRIALEYRLCKHASNGYSNNLNTFYFKLSDINSL